MNNEYATNRFMTKTALIDEIQNFICIEIHENNINYEKADLVVKVEE